MNGWMDGRTDGQMEWINEWSLFQHIQTKQKITVELLNESVLLNGLIHSSVSLPNEQNVYKWHQLMNMY